MDNNGRDHVEHCLPARIQHRFGTSDAAMALRAYDCAVERLGRHRNGHRRAASILLEQRADAAVIAASLLAPAYQQGLLSGTEIAQLFGKQIASLVVGASTDQVLRQRAKGCRVPDLRRWLASISVDLRTVALQLGVHLAALEAYADGEKDQGPDEDAEDAARQALELLVPLADRMGMGSLRTRLEDACFRLLQPALHAEMAKKVEPIRRQDQFCLLLLKDGVERLLAERGFSAAVEGRAKGLYSIYRKMRRLDISLDEVMDRIGLRIIVPSVGACYGVLDLLHTRFRPIPGAFDDYIGLPKANGYRSLHTCVYPVPDVSVKPVEFQIRTEEMHREAEYGVAAHWLYKDVEEAEGENRRQLKWLRGLLPEGDAPIDHAAFVRHLHRHVYGDRLTIRGHDGEPPRLPDLACGDRHLPWCTARLSSPQPVITSY